MIKKRIGAAVIVKDGIVVQSIGFGRYLPVGKPAIALEFLNSWGIDEIILVDISATRNGRSIDPQMVSEASKDCFVPLTVGGGITNIEQVDQLMQTGADKILLNHILLSSPELATQVARKYGDQCVVACMDIKRDDSGDLRVYNYVSKQFLKDEPAKWAEKLQSLGVGEILVQSVDRDGAKSGFETAALHQICEGIKVPVLALGGAGKPEHFLEVLNNTSVSAACAGNYFHFTEHSVITTKAFMIKNEMDIRLETYADYKNADINENNRLLKHNDEFLEHLLYLKIEKEVI